MLSFLFTTALFISALLLFSIQPMVAKALLPVYGGTPAVWTVCMLFFQIALLSAYAYAYVLSLFSRMLHWRLIHSLVVLLSLFSLPLLFKPVALEGIPEWSILYTLFSQLGVPLLVIAASAPLLQFAYSQSTGKRAADPYFLYAASNLGSLLSLLIYPFVERYEGLTRQFRLWSTGYELYLLLLFCILYFVSYKPQNGFKKKLLTASWKDMGLWVFLAFVPCSLMLGVTLYITTDVAATPLFWILPLALYLLSFVLSFTEKPLISPQWVQRNSVFFLIFIIIGFIANPNQIKAWLLMIFNLCGFFILAMLCHRQLYEKRPKTENLTLFYFCLALGGVLAGIFNGVLARHLFNEVYEYPIAIALSLLLIPLPKKKGGIWVILTVLSLLLTARSWHPDNLQLLGLSVGQIAVLLALTISVVWQQNKTTLVLSMSFLLVFLFSNHLKINGIILQDRSFYAVNRVVDQKGVHAFFSQSTLHGLQSMTDKKPLNGFTSYYGALEPIINALKTEFNSITATVMGLGTGTMACQFRESDKIKVIEIDPQVIEIAKNNQLFTYLRDCPAIEILKNDGRLAMTQLPDASQVLLVLDAFNSDAIPMHLLTLEAFQLYKRKILKNGAILVNLSNRHLNLLPLMNAMGRSLDFMVFYIHHQGEKKLGQFPSEWALLTTNETLVSKLTRKTGWQFLADNKQFLWTDDYSNILPLLRW